MLLEHTNLIVMGWISSGSTSTALILANILKKRFVYAGGMQKRIASELGYDYKSEEMIEYENKYGEKWDWIWEHYVLWKLQNEDNLLANAKIVGFMIDPMPNLFSSFVVASIEVRNKRASGDNRTEVVSDRGHVLQKRWKKLFNIDLLDIEEIKERHDFVIDNSNLSLAKTAFEIYQSMKLALNIPDMFTLLDFQRESKNLTKIGSKKYYNLLKSQNLLITHKEIANDWLEHFSQDMHKTSPEWQEAVQVIAE